MIWNSKQQFKTVENKIENIRKSHRVILGCVACGILVIGKYFPAACFVVDCGGGLAYDVINTIGQAFEIRFKMFLQNPPLATEVPER